MLAITLEVGGFTLTKGTGAARCATYFPVRRYTTRHAYASTPFIDANARAAEAYSEELGPFLRAYDARTSAQAVRRSLRYIDSKAV